MNGWKKALTGLMGPDSRARLEFDFDLGKFTSIRIGGPAEALVRPANRDQLRNILQICRDFRVDLYLLGRGTNVIPPDQGLRGAVLVLGEEFCQLQRKGNHIFAGAGYPLPRLARESASWGLSGLEFGIGIPGSVGGAICMNAGAEGTDVSQVASRVEAMTPNGDIQSFRQSDFRIAYRRSLVPGDYLILGCEFELEESEPRLTGKRVHDFLANRRKRTPLEWPSAGCIFRNPPGGMSAGKLIDESGCKGKRVGGAEVSRMHANYIVNTGGATASHVDALVRLVREKVRDRFQIDMETEAVFLGPGSRWWPPKEDMVARREGTIEE